MLRFTAYLLLEHDMNKTWENHGAKIHARMKTEKPGEFDAPWPQHDETDWASKNDAHAKKTFEDHLNQGDPTPTKKYGKWIGQRYGDGGINRLEDIPGRVNTALTTFHTNKHLLARHGIDPDINKHKSLSDLEQALGKLPEGVKSKRAEKADASDEMASQADHHEDEHWNIKVPHTEAASVHYGQGTQWCTAATNHNMFDHYSKPDDPLHIFIPKNPTHPGEKYQLHVGSEQFMNEKDEMVSPKTVFNGTPHYAGRPSRYLHDLITKNL